MSRSCTLGETGAAGSHHVTVIIVARRAWNLLEVGEMSDVTICEKLHRYSLYHSLQSTSISFHGFTAALKSKY